VTRSAHDEALRRAGGDRRASDNALCGMPIILTGGVVPLKAAEASNQNGARPRGGGVHGQRHVIEN